MYNLKSFCSIFFLFLQSSRIAIAVSKPSPSVLYCIAISAPTTPKQISKQISKQIKSIIKTASTMPFNYNRFREVRPPPAPPPPKNLPPNTHPPNNPPTAPPHRPHPPPLPPPPPPPNAPQQPNPQPRTPNHPTLPKRAYNPAPLPRPILTTPFRNGYRKAVGNDVVDAR